MILARIALVGLAVVALQSVTTARPIGAPSFDALAAEPGGAFALKGLNDVSLFGDLERIGLNCAAPRSAGPQVAVRECGATAASATFRTVVTLDGRGAVRAIVAAVSPSSGESLRPERAKAFLSLVGTLPDLGPDSQAAVRWISANVGRPKVSATFGTSFITLGVAGDPASYVLTLIPQTAAPTFKGTRLV